MSLTPLDAFNDALLRARRLADLYELLHNKRERSVRSDWAEKAKKLLGWKASDPICRIDGQKSVLLIREEGWDLEHFEHDCLGELLRSSLVSAVSALDRYLHDLISSKLLSLLMRDTPKLLAQFPMELADVKKMLQKAMKSRKDGETATRPRTILKECFRKSLNQQTFQGSVQIENALQMLNIKKCWGKIAQKMEGSADDADTVPPIPMPAPSAVMVLSM